MALMFSIKWVFQIEMADADSEIKRGWVLDNFPRNRSQLATIQDLHDGIMPDILFCLKDNDGEGGRNYNSQLQILP